MTDILLIVFVSISVFMASLFSTVTGFGFALVAVPFLMPVLGAHETVVFIIFGTCLVKMIVLWNTRKHFECRQCARKPAGKLFVKCHITGIFADFAGNRACNCAFYDGYALGFKR